MARYTLQDRERNVNVQQELNIMNTLDTVSYTHLDVYKRQILRRLKPTLRILVSLTQNWGLWSMLGVSVWDFSHPFLFSISLRGA